MQALVVRTQDPNGVCKTGFTLFFQWNSAILYEELKIWLHKYKDFNLHSATLCFYGSLTVTSE